MADKEKKEADEKIEKKDGEDAIQKLSDFIQRNRSAFLVFLILVVVALVGFIATTSVMSSLNAKAMSQVEALGQRYETLRFDIADASKDADVQTLLNDLAAFASAHKGYISARAHLIAASIYSDKKNWTEAEKAWSAVAVAAKGAYLEPVAMYNQAVALEEQNNAQAAIELFTKAAAFAEFPGASRAQFNIGRLREGVNKDEAIEAYRSLLSKWPNDDVWTSLAQSRIIALGLK
ncbi:MAG: tetratricopeptide repeat protein [Treponema sp.]|jgi:predicted negative regulator of RcsB-dependent stress response|nr:tetratricopeptide repeat protein [Treponema sp.]